MLTPADGAFLRGPFGSIRGWCTDEAAWLSAFLLRAQQSRGDLGPAFEIGVFNGKYFSVLATVNRSAGVRSTGFDTFDWCSVAEVESALTTALGDLDHIHLVKGDSAHLDPAAVLRELGGQPAGFVSIDGSHEPDYVFHDLELADAVLAPAGILSIDDFLNPMAVGVTEGAMRFLLSGKSNLVPFCYCCNKLFLARPAFLPSYFDAIPVFCEQNAHLPVVARMLETRDRNGLNWVQQKFLGRTVWIISPH